MREMYFPDYLSLAYQCLKYCYAWLGWKIKRIFTKPIVTGVDFVTGKIKLKMWGRCEDPTPVVCNRCMWMGMRKWVIHGYQDDGSGEDVVGVDACPRCGYEV